MRGRLAFRNSADPAERTRAHVERGRDRRRPLDLAMIFYAESVMVLLGFILLGIFGLA
jgi:hypothetical protein